MNSIPWSLALPLLAIVAFLVGILWKRAQDRTVETVKRWTIKPGQLHVSDLEEYARTHSVQ